MSIRIETFYTTFVIIILAFFIIAILHAAAGWLGGWLVGIFFEDMIHTTVRQLLNTSRFDGVTLAQFGASASFFASYIKPSAFVNGES